MIGMFIDYTDSRSGDRVVEQQDGQLFDIEH